MRSFRRSLLALGLAAMLPTIISAAAGAFFLMRTESARVQNEALARSENIMARIDALLRGDAAVLRALATSLYADTQDWHDLAGRMRPIVQAHPYWATVILVDAGSGQKIFDLRQPFAPPQPVEWLDRSALQALAPDSPPQAIVAGILERSRAEPLVMLYQPLSRNGAITHFLVLAIHPEVFQELLLEQALEDTLAAVVDRNGLVVARSRSAAALLGAPAERALREAIGRDANGVYRARTREGYENYTAFYTSPLSGWSAHIALPTSLVDTPARWSVLLGGLAVLGALALAAGLTVLVLRDMAERRRSEELLRQSQKMEAVGQLTGGIAHDFNNLLTAIIGNLDLIRTRAAGNERLERIADRALEAARLGARLASRLLAFSRTQRMALAPVDLQQVLNGMMALLRQSVGPTVQIAVDIAPDARVVLSERHQLELALLNIAVNARDAMPEGGRLHIRSRRVEKSPLGTLTPHTFVELAIADTGIGMSEEVRARALEPFYTTKPVGQGTGLGLSQVYGVVRESGGLVQIESTLGQGTTIKLLLPLAGPETGKTQLPVGAEAPTVPVARREIGDTVLVVDDDKRVRRFMADTLRELQYHVLEAPDGETALDILRAHSVHLLVVDFAMPGTNGAEVAQAARALRPGLSILMVSGYADSAAIEAALGDARLLRKPFDMAELAEAVAQLLGKTAAATGAQQ